VRDFERVVLREIPAGFLVLPAPGDSALKSLKKKLALLVLETLLVGPSPQSLRHFVETIARSADRQKLRAALERVDVMPPLLALRAGVVDPDSALADAVPALLAALGRSSESFIWDAPVRCVIDPASRRLLRFDPPARGLLIDPSGIEARLADGARIELDAPSGAHIERPFFELARHPGPLLSLVDTNPLAMLEEHPDKEGNALSLGAHPIEEWQHALAEALDLVFFALPDLHMEMLASLERIIPVGYEPEKHLSASYREAPGLVYLTLHPSPLTLAEAFIHETQHGKLNVLRWFDPLMTNADSAWTSSPVRPDMRPLSGVLLAVHAFVPVAALHLRLLERDHPISRTEPFATRRAEVLASNAEGLRTLEQMADPTPLGRKVLNALRELHDALA
jgi:HEXXH motif-containing protein